MARKVTSIKMEEEMITALERMAKQQNTTRHALVIEAVESILNGGMDAVFEKKIAGCLEHILGFQDKGSFDDAVEAKFGSMLVDLIDARLKVLFSIDLEKELQEGSLAALMQAQRPRPKKSVEIKAALDILITSFKAGNEISLDDLAERLQADKQLLAMSLRDAGVRTIRKSVEGVRYQFYMPDKLEAAVKARDGL